MQPIHIPFQPDNTIIPCLSLRSRAEARTTDAINARLVESWQTDAPALQYTRRDVSGAIFYMDMNPTASRLYREDLRQSQPFVVPTGASQQVRATAELGFKASEVLQQIQQLKDGLQRRGITATDKTRLQTALQQKESEYQILIGRQRQIQTDALADNPYFMKYDVASDSRNIARELRGAVTEDVVDRGVRESQKLMQREFDSRWLPANYAQDQALDSLTAYELLRPKQNNNEKVYR
jgi:hypothetical protein